MPHATPQPTRAVRETNTIETSLLSHSRILTKPSSPRRAASPAAPRRLALAMPRHRRAPRPPPIDDRDLAAEVLYLHSLWRRGPSARAPVPVPAAVPDQSRSGRRRPRNRKRRRSGRGASDSEDAGPGSPTPLPSPDASASASPAESTPPPSPSPVPAAPNQSRSGRRRRHRRKRRRSGRGNADADDAAPGSPHTPSPPAASEKPHAQAWPDAPTSSKPPPPQPPPSPGALAHRQALRAAADFFTTHGSDGEEDDDEELEVSESEGDEEEAAEFFTGMFERDAALRGHYERGWEDGQFACMACAGRGKARRGRARRFRGCVGLVQHARAATRFGRPGAHRALAAVVCRVLGWDIDRLPSIVIDPRGTLSQALAARAQSQPDVQKAKMGGSNTNGVELANQLVTSKESAGMNDVEEIGPLNSEDNSKDSVCSHETNQEEGVFKTGMEEPLSIGGEKVTIELDGDKESSEKEDAVKTGIEEHLSINGEKVATELDGDRESSEKDNSLSKVNNGVIHEQDIAKESTEKKNMKDTLSTKKCKTENSMKASDQEEENVDENKVHANSIVKFFEELENEDFFTS